MWWGSNNGTVEPPPPPPAITVSVQPGSANLFLGQQQQFQATVTGTSNTSVAWSVNAVAGGSSAVGTIASAGLYTAPSVLPANSKMTVSAASVADASASAPASVSLTDDIVVTVSPPAANVPAGGSQVFTAAITASGSPAPGVAWTVNGIAGGNATLGTIAGSTANSATYTAPVAPPSPPSVTITATSVADNTKAGSASVSLTCANLISPSTASVSLGQNAVVHGQSVRGKRHAHYLGRHRNHGREFRAGHHRRQPRDRKHSALHRARGYVFAQFRDHPRHDSISKRIGHSGGHQRGPRGHFARFDDYDCLAARHLHSDYHQHCGYECHVDCERHSERQSLGW